MIRLQALQCDKKGAGECARAHAIRFDLYALASAGSTP
jgi:hypothetical protein